MNILVFISFFLFIFFILTRFFLFYQHPQKQIFLKENKKRKEITLKELKEKFVDEIRSHILSLNSKNLNIVPYRNQIYLQTNRKDLDNKKQEILTEITNLVNSPISLKQPKEFQKKSQKPKLRNENDKSKSNSEEPNQEKNKEEQLKHSPNPKETNKDNQQNAWMKGDDIYSFYCSIDKKEGMLFLDPLYLGDLVNKQGEKQVYSIENLIKKKLNRNKLVFIPANRKNCHWSLFVYERETNIFHHYDSLNGLNFSYFYLLCEKILINKSLKSLSTNTIKEERTPQQSNGDDCGVYVMAITQFLVERYKKNLLRMSWEIGDSEKEEIHKLVREIRRTQNSAKF
ncbi:Ulp1 family isopeptidase [endosymbiont GvMRE of Glomus versiforme]|uniref:Ulp1 family isopeptidase n=1 Tax=endosymbiont GvMRE of Glomus versiforme TaxID=2039283 RepID=UPI000ED3101C|nr:Ulp1 family isopeptidase [endosymbiont GvMRE of Glomus versiforme]RHZ35248.1 Sentrin-specific protease 8 [endosymbiont GvMRE of Glomus versiforme]